MKQQLLAIVTSTLAAIAISGSAIAQSTNLTQLFPALIGVELQPAQTASLERLSQQVLADVRQALSPAQLQQFNLEIGQGKSVRATIAALDLSKAEKRSLANKLQSNRSQIMSILTREQQQQVAKNARSLQK